MPSFKPYETIAGVPIYKGSLTTGNAALVNTATGDAAAVFPTVASGQVITKAILSNVDGTNTIYFDWAATVSSTSFAFKLSAGEFLAMALDVNNINALYCKASANTPALRVNLFQ